MRKLIVTLALVAVGPALAVPAFAADPAAGKAHYLEQKCDKCHGAGGAGDGPTAKPLKLELLDWTDKAAMAKLTDAELHDIIEKGGKAVGKSPKMPGYGKKLDTTAIGDIVAWIRSLAP
jgi:mono/diheme cytochrome c family protein